MPFKRYSRQRELIYQAVRNSPEHPTAEMVYQQLKPDHPNLSRGTVYRNLHLLAEAGSLVQMPFPVERFDAETLPHTHFRCRACGRVLDLNLSYDPTVDVLAASVAPHVQVERHDLVFQGLCTECRTCAAQKEGENHGI